MAEQPLPEDVKKLIRGVAIDLAADFGAQVPKNAERAMSGELKRSPELAVAAAALLVHAAHIAWDLYRHHQERSTMKEKLREALTDRGSLSEEQCTRIVEAVVDGLVKPPQ